VEIVTATLSSIIALLLGAFVSRVMSDKKLDKLGDELKVEIQQTKLPIEEVSKSVLELDRKVIQLIERFTGHGDDIEELKIQIEELFNRIRAVETAVQLHEQRISDVVQTCRTRHERG
jgi:peptidoglycan hydrolase CwlO-like protein